jgi:hypothetical protein
MSRHTFSGNSGKRFELLAHVVAFLLNLVPRVAQAAETAGNVAGFRRWAKSQGDVRFYRNRESLWFHELVKSLPEDCVGNLIEFGVAFGEGTRWWAQNVTSPHFSFIGFDRFRGLPRAWRNMPAGAFDADGNPPNIDDQRIEWVVGDIEETLIHRDWSDLKGMKIVLFDLDLYGVSRACWESLCPHLMTGDVVFFDEAFDADERTLINEVVIPTGDFDVLAVSPLGIAFRRR